MQGKFLSELKGKIANVVVITVPDGTRVNAEVEGTLIGPKINGTIKAVDYVLFHTDGSGILHVHGVITTEKSDLVYTEASGFSVLTDQEGRSNIKETVVYQTTSKKYSWLNKTLVVGEGYTDVGTGEVHIKYYVPIESKE